MNKVKWIINEVIYNDSLYHNLPEIIQNLGMEVTIINNTELLMGKMPYNKSDCVITYASINVTRKLKDYFGTYMNEDNLKYSKYTSLLNVDPHLFLNNDAILTTFYNFKNNYQYYYDLFNNDRLFIKPNSGIKLFTGYIVPLNDINHELNYLSHTSLTNDSLLVISAPKDVKNEARFLIIDHNIVDSSLYEIGKYSTPEDNIVPDNYKEFVENIIKNDWQPDPIYSIDVGTVENELKIIELNSFSSAGLYAMDMNKVIKEVSEFTSKSYEDFYY